ncbi:hypothetical protein T484DRAFT_1794319 [Baffinella frigidus]|nr:hypothetical protein T484DRAFT_1794319 [Cryptophyta sp. CCMP2293]
MRVKAARGDSRLRVAETKTDLATDLNDAGEYEKASEELKEAIAIYEELRPEGNGIRVQLAATYDLLATVYKHQGRTKEALEQCQKCLVVGIKTMGWDHRDMAARYGNIGSVLSSLGKHEMALEQHQKCLEVQVKTLGAEHSSLAVTHGNIGSVYWKQSKHEQALASFTLSVAIYRKLCLVFDDQVTYKGALAEYTQCVTMLSAKVRQDASKSLPGAADITDAGSDNLKVGKGFTARFRRASIVVGETIGKFSERLSSSEGRLSSSDTTDRLSSSVNLNPKP